MRRGSSTDEESIYAEEEPLSPWLSDSDRPATHHRSLNGADMLAVALGAPDTASHDSAVANEVESNRTDNGSSNVAAIAINSGNNMVRKRS